MSSWVFAGLLGLLAGGALVLGAVVTLLVELPHRVIAAVMAFGSGVLVSVLGTELMEESVKIGGLGPTLSGFAAGAAIFSGANWLLSKRGAEHRNRCGDCVEQPKESAVPGSGLAIALGALLDGIPESLIVGLGVDDGKAKFAVIAGFFIANLPQGLSSASGMKQAGRGAVYILSIWAGIALISGLAAGIGNITLGGAPPEVAAIIKAFAAGAVLAMLAETMIPEAFEKAQSFIGAITGAGFFTAFLLSKALP
ncbi:MAG: hypothetical protein WKG00_04190 [Polyangiaceae bacterium]